MQLGDLAQNISRPFNFKGRKAVVFVNTGDVLEGHFLHADYSEVYGLPGQAKKRIEEGDILYSEIRPGNKRYVYVDFDPTDHVVSTKFMVVKANEHILPKYLYLVLTSEQCEQEFKMIAESRSGTFPQITFDSVDYYPIQVPPLGVQAQIVSIVGSIDNKLNLNRQTNQTLEQIAQTIFKSWFVDFEPVKAKIEAKAVGRDPERAALCAISGKTEPELDQLAPEQYQQLVATAALFPDELVESELGLIPQGWVVASLDSATSLIIDHRGKTPIKLGGDWTDSGYPALSAKNVKGGHLVQREAIRYVDDQMYRKWMKDELDEGDILLTSEAPLGETYFLAVKRQYVLSQRLYAIRAGKEITGAYLYHWLNTSTAQSDIAGRETGTTATGIRQSELRKVLILMPGKVLAERFAETTVPLMKQIHILEEESLALASLRDTLLPKLLSGEMQVCAAT